jgi:hypothetical protein
LKFGNLADAEKAASFHQVTTEREILKPAGIDRIAYVHAMQKLCEWRHDADLRSTVMTTPPVKRRYRHAERM